MVRKNTRGGRRAQEGKMGVIGTRGDNLMLPRWYTLVIHEDGMLISARAHAYQYAETNIPYLVRVLLLISAAVFLALP